MDFDSPMTQQAPHGAAQNVPSDTLPDIPTINTFASFANDEDGDALPFYEAEGRILALWDQLNELKLEIFLLEAQADPPPPVEVPTQPQFEQQPLPTDLLTTLREAEKECLEARAAYSLRQSVVEDVLVTAPILKAVHSGSNATPTEQTLRPLIDRRDILSIASTNLTSALQQIRVNTTKIDVEHSAEVQRNRGLAPMVSALAREVKKRRDEAMTMSGAREQLEEAMEDAAEGKRRWRIMKSVIAAVIAGSGVDWVGDGALRELVLDDETADGID